MLKGKACQPVMSLRERQQMNLDTESATHTGMESQSRSSHKYLFLQVWCGLLTVAMVVMAALLTSNKLKTTEEDKSTLKPQSSPVSPTANTHMALFKSERSPSYIQLIRSQDSKSEWEVMDRLQFNSLFLENDSIHFKEGGIYFIYALVNFHRDSPKNITKSVLMKRNAMVGKDVMVLVEGTSGHSAEDSLWVARIVHLEQGSSVSITITGKYFTDTTFWGAFKLH